MGEQNALKSELCLCRILIVADSREHIPRFANLCDWAKDSRRPCWRQYRAEWQHKKSSEELFCIVLLDPRRRKTFLLPQTVTSKMNRFYNYEHPNQTSNDRNLNMAITFLPNRQFRDDSFQIIRRFAHQDFAGHVWEGFTLNMREFTPAMYDSVHQTVRKREAATLTGVENFALDIAT